MAITVIIFDALAYLFLPMSSTAAMKGYRSPTASAAGHGAYPKDYFKSHTRRGFDIQPGARGRHVVDGLSFDVWGNEIGCYDDRNIEIDTDYIYFAGDSYLWGYVPQAVNFSTLLADGSTPPILNCGVGHTGQRHQLSKYQEVRAQIGHAPGHVMVFYAANDVANDYAFPHSKVIDGWLVDHKKLGQDFKLISIDDDALQRYLAKALSNEDDTIKTWIKRYSAIAHLVDAAVDFWKARQSGTTPAPQSIYALSKQKEEIYPYHNFAYAAENKGALQHFRDIVEDDGARLIVVLIPPREHFDDPTFYQEIKAFLEKEDIEYLDLAKQFQQLDVAVPDLYYPIDPHFHEEGHRQVAASLTRAFPALFKSH